MSGEGPRYYGLYRATVVNNIDPLQRGRIQVIATDATGLVPTTWCEPCVPMAGIQQGIYTVPIIGAGVWIQFENGDPDQPVWIGGWWGSAAEVPALALLGNPATPNIVLQTTLQNTILISDVPGPTGGIMLKSTTGAFILVNDTGITIQNGKGAVITLIGPAISIVGSPVTTNAGALVVT
jgi:uncharacterized protein involved in type VI secretion and phage assembly